MDSISQSNFNSEDVQLETKSGKTPPPLDMNLVADRTCDNINMQSVPVSPEFHQSAFNFKFNEDTKSGDIRHQLLAQRTFNAQEDYLEPKTSSPMRKVRICTSAPGAQTVTISSTSGTSAECCTHSADGGDMLNSADNFQPHISSPFVTPSSDSALGMTPQMAQAVFKTPVRGQQHVQWEHGVDVTPSHGCTPMHLSPAGWTPGRQFVNPFEVDPTRLHLPMFSPNLFKVADSAKKGGQDKEAFWSIEHSALLRPAEIKESEVYRQHRFQQKFDKEQDTHVQSAIDKFFSNKMIVPSPWSEKVNHVLPRTPGSIKSVSCQTSLSVPPHADLWEDLGEKYQLPDFKTDSSPSTDLMGNSFIRRKLLHQLNENESGLTGSPIVGAQTESDAVATWASPTKQTTPEWEKKTPNKIGSGHFSSSPIRQVSGDRGHRLSESDLLASPELSPIAGRGNKSTRSSGIFFSHQNMDSPRALMPLDFSSILDDPDEINHNQTEDKTETLVQSELHLHQGVNSSSNIHDSSCIADPPNSTANNSDKGLAVNHSRSHLRDALITSEMSSESTNEMALAVVPQSYCNSQDTGYQTASLQSMNFDSGSTSNLTSQDTLHSVMFNPSLESNSVSYSSLAGPFSVVNNDKEAGVTCVPCRPDTSELPLSTDMQGSFLEVTCRQTRDAPGKQTASSIRDGKGKKGEFCIRKVRTLSDIRYSREKSNVSRDLTHSFNDDTEVRSEYSGENKQRFFSDSSMLASTAVSVGTHFLSCPFNSIPLLDNQKTPVCPVLSKRLSGNEDKYDEKCNVKDTSLSKCHYFHVSNLKEPENGCFSSNSCDTQTISDKNIETLSHVKECAVSDSEPQFSLGDDQTLQEARELLGKSEQLRKKHVQPTALESDSLFQMISSENENVDPCSNDSPERLNNELQTRCQTPPFKIDPINSSTPTSRMLSSGRRRINRIQSGRLGSEIAEEVLKRAGEDLAKLTYLTVPKDLP